MGWDIFSLEYHIKNSPIEVMLYARDKRGDNKFWGSAGYRRIFAFLWKLKRVEYMLSRTWRRHVTAYRRLSRLQRALARRERLYRGAGVSAQPAIGALTVLHRSHLFRNQMIHFASNLQNYVMFEGECLHPRRSCFVLF